MRATQLDAVRTIALHGVPDPVVQQPSDVVVRVTASCICGSDLHPYRGTMPSAFPQLIGHEFIGVVEETGADVRTLAVGDLVIAPFTTSCGACASCRRGITSSCVLGAGWGRPDRAGAQLDGGQGERVRVPLADGTLVPVRDRGDATDGDLLTLSDVMATGHHAAVTSGVGPGSTVVVVGDGAVGLCAIAAARRLGAERIVAMSRHADRQAMALELGATDIVAERGKDGVASVRSLVGRDGADAVCECVGTQESLDTAVTLARPGGRVGVVGIPAGQVPFGKLFVKNVGLAGGVAPVRSYLPGLLADVVAGSLRPGLVFDLELPLDEVAEGYRAMDERRAVKVLLRP
ncbi:MAG: putative Zn-containing alcohol dehydrogenase [Blastococcus sp.]|jgi:threonine dehydrogenase-like Zn-dependent dehydrogenase|nr:putative Zn-containing alcohol dehydrogenase [Blastococcus sp.]